MTSTPDPLRPTSLRELKGAPLSCLLALFLIGCPATKDDLADETGYRAAAIEDALRFLSNPKRNLAIAIPNGRHPKWQLTAQAVQMPLWADVSREKRDSPGSGGSLIYESNSESSIQLLLQPVSREKSDSAAISPQPLPDNPQVYPQAHRAHPQVCSPTGSAAVALLVQPLKDLGCPENRAVAAVTQALNRGESAQAVAKKIVAGMAYAGSPAGRTIRSPGHWLAACLADGRAIPAPQEGQTPDWERDYSGYLPYADNVPDADVDTPNA